jgi:hypothetical protein
LSVQGKLIAATRAAYRRLENDENSEEVYASVTAFYATHGLDANVAESSIDWLEGGTLAEDLERELNRLGIVDDDEPAEPCDCGDFAHCSTCRAWAENELANGWSPWDGKQIRPGETVAPLPPWT